MEARSRQSEKRRGPLAKLIDFAGWLLLVGMLVVAVMAAGWLYLRSRTDDEIRSRVEQKLAEHYSEFDVSVGAARLVEGRGIEIRKISIRRPHEKALGELVRIEEIFVACDATLQNLMTGRLSADHLKIRGLKLRAVRQSDGTWDTSGLFPLPKFGAGATPKVSIEESSIEIIDVRRGSGDPLVLRDVELNIEPSAATATSDENTGRKKEAVAGGPILQVRGHFGGDHFQRINIEGEYNPSDGRWSIHGSVEDLAVSPRLLELLPPEIISSNTLPQVRGRVNLEFQIRNPEIEDAWPQFAVSGTLQQGQIDDSRLPAPLTDVKATFSFNNREIKIVDLTAAGGLGSLRLALRRDGYAEDSPMVVRAKTEKLVLDHRLSRVLPAELKTTWDQFAPQGLVDADVKLTFDGKQWKPEMELNCLGVSFAYYKYPYRFESGVGSISYRDDRVVVHVRALAAGQTIHFDGDIQHPGPTATGNMNVILDGPIPLDEKLLSSLNADTQRIVRELRPRGSITFAVHLSQRDEPGALPEKYIKIKLHDCAINYRNFPYPIDKIQGVLELRNGQWQFLELSGYNDSGNITCTGGWSTDTEGHGDLTFNFVATEVPLEDELRDALQADVRRLWSDLRLRGTLDNLKVGIRYSTKTKKTKVEIQALELKKTNHLEDGGISIEPVWFPYRLDHLSGNFVYRDGRIELHKVAADHGRTYIKLAGFGETLKNGAWQFRLTTLSADQLRIDNDLLAALPETLRKGVAKLKLSSPLNIDGAVGFAGGKRTSLESNWDLTFDVEDGNLDCGILLEHIRGGVRLFGVHGPRGMLCNGELAIDSAVYKGVQLTKIAGPLRMDKENLFFGTWTRTPQSAGTPRQVTAELFGGKLAGDAQISLTGDSRFALHATLSDADLKKLSQELMPRSNKKISGKGNAVLDLQGVGGQTHTLNGKGLVRLRSADIQEAPVILALLEAIIRRPDAGSFTAGDMDFRIRGEDIYFDRINFSGDAISLKGQGHMDFDRQIDLNFYTVVGRDKVKIPFISTLLGAGSRELLRIRVDGSIDNPVVSQEVLPALNETLQQLFPELARTPNPRKPVPPIPRR